MASLALLASLGSLHIDPFGHVHVVSYDVACIHGLPWPCARRRFTALNLARMDNRYYCAGKSLLTHFVMKHHYYSAGTRKKRPALWVFFFLPAFGRCCPSVSAHTANCIRCSSNIAIAYHFPSKTFSFKHHLTGEAWPACRAILPFHSNTT